MDTSTGIGSIGHLSSYLQKFVFNILSVGPIPKHIALIMDGNRRYAKQHKIEELGHRVGIPALFSMLKHSYGLGIPYVTLYAFSIDNFKRSPDEIASLMDVLQEKIEEVLNRESILNIFGVRIFFSGNLNLLSEGVKSAAERAMMATADNSRAFLTICVAYTSTDEIVHAVQESCRHKQNDEFIKVEDIEKHMYMAVAPDPDIIIRTSGETRLSNFLMWQSARSCLYSPLALWPEIGFRHFVWSVLNFQRNSWYSETFKL